MLSWTICSFESAGGNRTPTAATRSLYATELRTHSKGAYLGPSQSFPTKTACDGLSFCAPNAGRRERGGRNPPVHIESFRQQMLETRPSPKPLSLQAVLF
jgi:hypothetical protein